jgi:Siphovirus ReqiPepy6 Gp37-like protein
MEVYILDDSLRRSEVVDRFESLIWTERYTAYGDFELVTHSTSANRSLFPLGTRLALNESERVMQIDTIENKLDADGKRMLTISGRSLESILEDRIASDSILGTNLHPKWNLSGKPADIARSIFNAICRTGYPSSTERIPNLEAIIANPPFTRPEPSDIVNVSFEPTTVYKAIQDICLAYDIGFSLTRIGDTGLLRFRVWTGDDRTLYQTNFKPVIFSHEMDNLENISELTSDALYKNTCYVITKTGVQVFYAPGIDPSVSGFERRAMMVKYDGDETGTTLTTIAQQMAYEELAKARRVTAFDGEIPQRGSYKYNRDYRLGDLVELRNSDGISSQMRVTEQIFSSDHEGDKSYPTLVVDNTATVGSWAAATNVDVDTWAERTDTWATA